MLEQSAKLQPGPRIAVSGASLFGTEGLIDLLEAPEAQEASQLTLMDHPSATGQRGITQSPNQLAAQTALLLPTHHGSCTSHQWRSQHLLC